MTQETLNIGDRRLRLHGPDAFQCLQAGQRLLRRRLPPVLKAVCGRTADEAKAFADKWGYESVETDWRKLVERKDIDAIDICTPNNTHAEIAIAAAEAGKMVLCEKPLSMNLVEGQKMVDADREGRRAQHGLVQLSPRAGRDAGQATDRRGQARARSSTTGPTSCRTGRSRPTCRRAAPGSGGSTSAAAGSGVTGDLLAHCIDTALWLNGAIDSVCAMTETFVKERKHNLTGKVEPVGIDDACAFLCRFGNGSLGLFESTRYARGHKALYTFEINGEKASLKWDLHDLHRLEYFDHGDDGDRPRLAIDPRHRRRPPLHEELVGAGPADRLRAHVRASGRRLPREPRQGQADQPRPSATPSPTQAVCDAVLDSAEHQQVGGGCAGVTLRFLAARHGIERNASADEKQTLGGSDRMSIGAGMLLIAGAALGFWLALNVIKDPGGADGPGTDQFSTWVFGLCVSARGAVGYRAPAPATGRPVKDHGVQADSSGLSRGRRRGCCGRRRSTTGSHQPAIPMSAMCFLLRYASHGLYVTLGLLAGGHLKRSRRHRMRCSWQETFGLLLGLAWACTGLYIISLFYRQDFTGK